MGKLLVNDEWYEPLSSTALYESQFEQIVIQNCGTLFPGFRAVPFKKTVYSETDAARADYALIEDEYREWWIVEVELGGHSLERHVLPQVTTLARARYGQSEADYLTRKVPTLNGEKLLDMMKGEVPRVLVAVNQQKHEWVLPLRAVGAEIAVFEIFRSPRNAFVYRFNGFVPSCNAQLVSRCRLDRSLPWMLQVDSPAALNVERHERLAIQFQEQLTSWKRIDSSDKVWLAPDGNPQVCPRTEYELVRLVDGSYHLREHHV